MGSTAWVLAGGGSLGAVQVGMLAALLDFGQRPDWVVGTSAGAMNAVYFGHRPDQEGVRRLGQIWRRLRRRDVFPVDPLRAVLAVVGGSSSLLRPDRLRHLIKKEVPYQKLEEASLPCHLVATDVLSGSRVAISKGPVQEALLASTAIPGIFPPVRLQGKLLFDGGVADNTPLMTAVELGATSVVVLPTGSPCALQREPAGAVAIALQALNLLIARQLVGDLARLSTDLRVSVVPPLCPLQVSSYDFSRADELIRRAEESTRRWLARGGLQRGGVPASLIPHHHGNFS